MALKVNRYQMAVTPVLRVRTSRECQMAVIHVDALGGSGVPDSGKLL
jgi:hypothetical protein